MCHMCTQYYIVSDRYKNDDTIDVTILSINQLSNTTTLQQVLINILATPDSQSGNKLL